MTTFFTSYVTTALRSSTDDTTPSGGYPLDRNYSPADIAPATLALMKTDCESFQAANHADLADIPDSQAGADFWLTRNRHGAGFWERGLGEVGDRLTTSARSFGEFNLYVGDDDQIHGG